MRILLSLVILILSHLAPKTESGHKIRVLKTAYCLRGHTVTGTRVHHGTIAVDPRYIRLGTRMYIPGYGKGRAEDTGGAIKGAHIDVWMPSCPEAFRATRHNLQIVLY